MICGARWGHGVHQELVGPSQWGLRPWWTLGPTCQGSVEPDFLLDPTWTVLGVQGKEESRRRARGIELAWTDH